MNHKQKLCLLIVIFLLLQAGFLQEAAGESPREVRATQNALSKSFYGVLDGMGSVGKGMWGLTLNSGKLLWHGTRTGMTKGARGAKKTDAWMRKHLW